MMKFIAFLLMICAAAPASALTCKNDYDGASGCASNTTAAGDCTTLGFSKEDTSGCSHYIYCPFDPSYKRCVNNTATEPSTCPAGYGKTVNDCGRWSMGWTLGTLNSSGCGKCIKKSCPSGSATTAAGCASGVITSEIAYAYSGDDFCYNCQPVSTPTCSSGYATSVSGCPDNRLYVLDTSQKDAAGCYKCVMKTCSYYGLEPMSSSFVNDGYHLCKKVHEYGLTCQDCVPCSAATICPKTFGVCDWRLHSSNGDVHSGSDSDGNNLCIHSSTQMPLLARIMHRGTFKDNDGRQTTVGCYVLDFIKWKDYEGDTMGCCRSGPSGSLTLSNEIFPGMGMTINGTTCPSK